MDKSVKKKLSVKKNLVLNVIRVGFNTLFPIITFPIVLRALGPENYGKVNFSISVLNYFVLFASMGIPAYGVIVCAKVRNDRTKLKKRVCELIYLNAIMIVLSYIVFFIVLFMVQKFKQYRSLLLLNSISILFTPIGIEWLYNSLEDFQYITIRSLIVKIISLLLIVLLVKQSSDYYIYALILVFASVGSNLCNLVHARKYLHLYKIQELNIKQHLAPVIAFFAASVASTINSNTDVVMLGFFDGDYNVGLYTFSVKVKTLLISVLTAGLNVVLPRLAFYLGQNQIDLYKTKLRKVVLLTMCIAFYLGIFFILCGKECIMILGGEEYLPSLPSMNILTFCIIVLGMTWSLGVGVLQVSGREKQYTRAIVISTIINVVLNSLLIPWIHVVGAAIATLVSEISNMVLFYFFTKDFLDHCLSGLQLWKVTVASIISFLACQLIRHIYLSQSSIVICIFDGVFFSTIYIIIVFLWHREARNILIGLLHRSRG